MGEYSEFRFKYAHPDGKSEDKMFPGLRVGPVEKLTNGEGEGDSSTTRMDIDSELSNGSNPDASVSVVDIDLRLWEGCRQWH